MRSLAPRRGRTIAAMPTSQTNGSYGTNGCTSNQTPGIYNPLSTARWDADHAIKNLTEWTDAQVPNRQALLAKAGVYAGFSYALAGHVDV